MSFRLMPQERTWNSRRSHNVKAAGRKDCARYGRLARYRCRDRPHHKRGGAGFRETDVDGKDVPQNACEQDRAAVELDGKKKSMCNRSRGEMWVWRGTAQTRYDN